MQQPDRQSQLMLEKLQNKLRETLERSNIAYMGEVKLVRIPRMPSERIRKIPRSSNPEDYSVEYIAEQWYDEQSGQSRNRKYIIGSVIHDYPMAMLPNENYYKYFDEATGLPRDYPEKKTQPEKDKDKAEHSREAGSETTASNKTGDRIKVKSPQTKEEAATTEKQITKALQNVPQGERTKAQQKSQQEQKAQQEEKSLKAEKTSTEGNTSVTGLTDDGIDDILRQMAAHRKTYEEEKIRNAIKEDNQKRDRELYGEEEYGEAQEREQLAAMRRLMELFKEDEPDTKATETENNMSKEEPPEEATNQESTQTKKEPEKPEEPDLQQTYREYVIAKERQAILGKILNEVLASIRNLAKKRPDDLVNEYKANRINRLLKEAISRYENSGYEDLMELIELPKQEAQDGRIIQKGMTYSDLELLLDHYCTILHFIPADKQK